MAKNTIIFACLEEVTKKEIRKAEKRQAKLKKKLDSLVKWVSKKP